MKTIKQILFIIVLALTVSTQLQAQDTIRLKWMRGNSLQVSTGSTGTIKVDWGDGRISTNSGGNRYFSINYYADDFYDVMVTTTGCRIERFICSNQKVYSSDFSKATSLKHLYCGGNKLLELDVTKNTLLQILSCDDNQLTTLDVRQNTILNNLYVHNNRLKELKVGGPISLLNCENNELTLQSIYDNVYLPLGVSALSAFYYMQRFSVANKDIAAGSSIDFNPYFMASGNNSIILTFNGLPALEGSDYTESSGIITFLSKGIYNVRISNDIFLGDEAPYLSTQILVDPDIQNIKLTWVVENLVNTNTIYLRTLPNTDIFVDWGNNTIEKYHSGSTGDLNIQKNYLANGTYNVSISSLNRIESFHIPSQKATSLEITNCPFLEEVSCYDNRLTSIDVSNLKNLRSFEFSNNPLLTEVNISGCTSLTYLGVYTLPSLTRLNLEGCTEISNISIHQTNIDSLDLTSLANLQSISIYELPGLSWMNVIGLNELVSVHIYTAPKLKQIDLSNLQKLISFDCNYSGIESLAILNSPLLQSISINYTPLTSLTLNNNSALQNFTCENTNIDSLDLSMSPNIGWLSCNYNKLEYFNPGNNTVVSGIYLGNNYLANLDSLHTFAQRYPSAASSFQFGTQSYKNAIVTTVGTPVGYSSQDTVDGQPSVFTVVRNGFALTEGVDYTLTDGEITFLNSGTYVVQITNTKLPTNTMVESTVLIDYVPDNLNFTWNADKDELKDFSITATKGAFIVDWGDGTNEEFNIVYTDNTVYPRKTYLTAGQYTVTITSQKGSIINSLDVNFKKVTDIDVSNAINLVNLYCGENSLTSLDVTSAVGLKSLNCDANNLESLTIGSNLEYLNCSNNYLFNLPYVYSLQQNVLYSAYFGEQQYKQKYSILSGQSVDYSSQLLVDGEITTFQVKKISQELAIEGIDYTISNGIITFLNKGAYFVKMENASKLAYTAVESTVLVGATHLPQQISFVWEVTQSDILNNRSKIFAIAYSRGAFTIDWGNGVVESHLNSRSNGITPFFNYSSAGQYNVTIQGDDEIVFKYFSLNDNSLSTLDVSNCWGLIDLIIAQNKLTDLNLDNCLSLTYLQCSENLLSELNLAGCYNLSNLECANNQITSLDVRHIKNISAILAERNMLTSLQIPENADIQLNVQKNRLSLDSMYSITQKVLNPSEIYLEWQIIENPINLAVNQTRSYDNVAPVLNSVNSEFEIYKDDILALEGTQYTLVGTDLTFHEEGVYSVHVKNTKIQAGDNPYGVTTAIVGNNTTNIVEVETEAQIGNTHKYFSVAVSKGVDFTVDWGDGNVEIYKGEGENNPSYIQHQYGYTGIHYKIKIETKGSLSKLYIQNAYIKKLNIKECPSLIELHCQYNDLQDIDVTNNALLNQIECSYNYLPFPTLFNISSAVANENNKYIGRQYIHSKDGINVEIGNTVDYSSQINFTEQGNTTNYTILRNSYPSVQGTDYIINNGILSFLRLGSYEVSFTNNAIISSPYYPAKIIETINVKLSNNATLKTLAVNGVNLPMVAGRYLYYVNFENDTTTAKFTAETTSSAATILSGLDTITLTEGINIHNILVRAQDGALQNYMVEIVRRNLLPNNNANLQSLAVSNTNINFTPTVYDYNVTFDYGINIATITPRLTNANTIVIGGNLNDGTNLKVLTVGMNVFTITVMSEDASDTLTYTINILRNEPDATLKSLTLNGESIVLIPDLYTYSYDVCPGTTAVFIEAETNNPGAAVTGTGNKPVITRNNTFILTVTSAEGVAKQDYIITINSYAKLAGGKIGNNKNICYNSVVNDFNSTEAASGGKGFYKYQWQWSINQTDWNDIVGATNEVYATTDNLTTNTYFRRQATDSLCGIAYSDTIAITVYDELLGGEIGSSQNICYNTIPSTFTEITAATGGIGTYTYQWQSSTDSITWTDISGATNISFAETNTLTDTMYYRRAVTSGLCGTVYSDTIKVVVYNLLQAGTVGNNQNICYNTIPSAFTEITAASGGNGIYTYQWQSSMDSITWTDISGATNISFAETNALTDTIYYRRTVTSGICGTMYSDTIRVSVYSSLTAGKIGSNQSICYNTIPSAFTSVELPIGGTGIYTYQWQSSTDSITWTDISGATNISFAEINTLIDTMYYRRAETSELCGTVYSDTIKVIVYDELKGGKIAGTQSVCLNTVPVAFTSVTPASGGQQTYIYQWQSSTDLSNWQSISGPLEEINTETNPLTQTTHYRRAVTDKKCGMVYSDTITVSINTLPMPSIAGNNTVCFNSVNNVYTTESGMSNYTWLVSGGEITSAGTTTDNTITITWNRLGVGTVSVNYTNNNGCIAALPTVYNVMVNSLPVPVITGSASVCLNSTANKYVTQKDMSDYNWSVTGGTITSGQGTDTVYVTWISQGAQSISVSYVNENNCSAVASTVYNVTVNPLPTPSILGATSVCLNSVETYTTEVGKSNYIWSVVGGTITSGGTTTDNTISVTWNTSGKVSVNYIDANGCTAVAATDSNVTVNPHPTPSILGATSVCLNSVETYTTEVGKNNYIWSVVGGTITSGGTTTDNTISVTWNTSGKVSVNYIDANGCTAVAATDSNVTVNPHPTPSILGATSVCLNSVETYTTEVGKSNYIWSVVGGTITSGGTTTDNTISVTWNTSGKVSVNYIDANGCTAVAATDSNVTVNPHPTPSILGATSVCLNSVETYTTEVGKNNYIWSVVGGTITSSSNTETATVFWNTAGTKTISVNYMNINGCVSATDSTILVETLPLPIIAGNNAVCINSINEYTTDKGKSNYNWGIEGGDIVFGQGTDSISVIWMTQGLQKITVNYQNGNCIADNAYSVNVDASSIPTIMGKDTVCEGAENTIYVTESGMSNYIWSITGGSLVSGQGTNTISVNWSIAGEQKLNISYRNSNNCIGINDYNVKVYSLHPTINGPNVACFGAETMYYTERGMQNYNWMVTGGTIIFGQTTDSILVKWHTEDTGIVKVTYLEPAGCIALSNNYAVLINPLVKIQEISTSLLLCEGEAMALEVKATGTNLLYQWNFNGIPLLGKTDSVLNIESVSKSNSGSYSVLVSTDCGVIQSLPIPVTVNQKSILVKKWDDVLLIDNTSNKYIGYQWYHNGAIIEGATRQFYQQKDGLAGTYSVQLLLVDGTKEYTCDTTFTNMKKEFQVKVYPIPAEAGSFVTVSYDEEKKQRNDFLYFELFDITGRRINKGRSKESLFKIPTNQLTSGTYLLRITTYGGRVFNEKLIIK